MPQNTYAQTEQTVTQKHSVNTDPHEVTAHGRPMYPGWRLLAICALALLAAGTFFSLTGGLSLTSMQKTLPTRAFSLSGHGTLVVKEIIGSVHIHPGEANQIVVRGSEHAVGLASSLNNLQVQYTQSGNTVTVSSSENWALAGDSELSLDITVPASIDITIHNISADATIDGITGPIDASASSGNLELNDTNGPLNLNTRSGDISLNNDHGSVSAHTTSGDISARGLTGPVNLSTSSGNITLEQAQLSSQDLLQTTSGDIDVSGTLDPRGTCRMETSSGTEPASYFAFLVEHIKRQRRTAQRLRRHPDRRRSLCAHRVANEQRGYICA
jgi:DUF4097 and DUF4098 domain-containing protein YvlB